jgi:O-methyltransferase involved in polyketide biosynthesis
MSVPEPRSVAWPPPTSAQVQDCWLGGKDNFQTDRNVAAAINEVAPWVAKSARARRLFINRAVIHMCELGIDQFVDLGCGLPHDPYVHQVAQVRNPRARTVYLDNDPMVVAHVRARMATDERTIAIEADARATGEVLTDGGLTLRDRPHLDLARPVGVIAAGLLDHLTDAEAVDLVRVVRRVCTPGSCLVIAHLSADPAAFDRHWKAGRAPMSPHAWQQATVSATDIYRAWVAPLHLRTGPQIRDFFQGCELLRPALVPADRWRAPGVRGPAPVPVLAGVGQLSERVPPGR